ncbi:hypothetical protein Acr_01g0014880 [Actinidia rufa]|uniref:Uncharacterized protein n=1 Tax=Actinidia rufa TaxID=165716 RepID=A0A7J0E5I8_9ERIC|nr:hypothetical protein Acr_01g0014880 [Actinidia rufa]
MKSARMTPCVGARCRYYSTLTLLGWKVSSSYRYRASSETLCVGARISSYQRRMLSEIGPSLPLRCPLFSELKTLTALQAWMKGNGRDNPKRCLGTKGDVHVRVPSDSPHTLMETSAVDDELLATP